MKWNSRVDKWRDGKKRVTERWTEKDGKTEGKEEEQEDGGRRK